VTGLYRYFSNTGSISDAKITLSLKKEESEYVVCISLRGLKILPNHMRKGFENAVAVYSFLPVEMGCPQPHVSYFGVGERFSIKYMTSGSGKTTKTRRAMAVVEMVAGKTDSVEINRLELIKEIMLTPTSGEDMESMILIK
jgi:hypothetical protein